MSSLSETARHLADQIEALQKEVEELQAQVEALNLIKSVPGRLSLTESAKFLDLERAILIEELVNNRWIYRESAHSPWLPYDDKRKDGLLEYKVHAQKGRDGVEYHRLQTVVTAKGIERLANVLPSWLKKRGRS